MGLFDRNPKQSGSDDQTAPAERDDSAPDFTDDFDDIDIPDADTTRPISDRPLIREESAEPAEPAGPVDSPQSPVEHPVADGDGDTTEDLPGDPAPTSDSRDIYAVTGRARPQRIEPRTAEPKVDQSTGTSGTPGAESFGVASGQPAGGDPAFAADHTTAGATADDDNRTLAFGEGTPAGDGTPAAETPRYATGTDRDGDVGGSADTSVFAAGQPGQPDHAPDGAYVVDPVEEEATAEAGAAAAVVKRGTLDFGLFILRAVIGAVLAVRGLQTLFAFGGDPGISAFEQTLAAYNAADILAVAVPVTQIVAGGLLLFGLLTPVGSALTIVVAGFLMIHHLAIWDSGYWPYTLSPQVQVWALVGLAGVVLAFTGPGRYAADISRGWATRPLASAWVFVLVGLAGAAGLWLIVGGGNPF